MKEMIAAVLLAVGLLAVGYFGHAVLSPVPQAAAVATTGEKISEGITIINVMSGAKVFANPGADFIVSAPEGGVTVLQMPQPAQKAPKGNKAK